VELDIVGRGTPVHGSLDFGQHLERAGRDRTCSGRSALSISSRIER
jgi:hypothetical protein